MAWTEVDSAVTSPAETGLTAAVMTADVIRNCNNLPSQHTHYSSILKYINEAKDEFMTWMITTHRGLLSMMPRLQNWRWYDVTVDGQGYLVLPSTMLTFESAAHTKSTAAYVPGTTTEYPMFPEPDPILFGQFSKTSTGWPVMYRRNGSRVDLWPTPDSSPTNYLTQVVIRGTRKEDDISGSQTYKMDAKLHSFVVELATAIAMEKMGWEEAPQRRASVERRLSHYKNISAGEAGRSIVRTHIAGLPTR
jgi:hypothetical protein